MKRPAPKRPLMSSVSIGSPPCITMGAARSPTPGKLWNGISKTRTTSTAGSAQRRCCATAKGLRPILLAQPRFIGAVWRVADILQPSPLTPSHRCSVRAACRKQTCRPSTEKPPTSGCGRESAAARVHIRLSHMYEHGLGVEKSLYEALSHSLRAEEIEPSPRLSYHIAQLMEKHGMSESVIRDRYREALEGMLREAADPNAPPDRQRNYRIASMYHYGRGTEPDAGKALEWYLKDMGNAHCRFGAATLLRYGEGVPTDPGRAAALYRSCLEGNGYIATESAYALAQMQRMNLLPETDMQALYRKAADVWLQQEAPEERGPAAPRPDV